MENENQVAKKEIRQPLMKNTVIFAIGTISTKLISIIMVPLYTFLLTQSEYGVVDILGNTANLIVPIFTLAIAEGVLRFTLNKDADHKKIFTTGLLVILVGMVVMLVSMFIASRFIYTEYTLCVLLFFSLEMLMPFLQYFMKGIGKTIEFVISSVLYAFLSTGAIVLLLNFTSLRVVGYFYGTCIGAVAFLVFCFFSCKLWKYFSFKAIDKKTTKALLLYSIPLIASNVSYWIITASDVYVTKIIMGEEANGILAIVRKIPAAISLVYSIFISAFSLSSISDHNFVEDNNEKEFYQKNFTRGVALLVLALGVISIIIEPLSRVIFASDFYSAWQYVPLYCVGIGFGCFVNYIEVIFKVTKKTSKIMIGTIISALINLGVCISLMLWTPIGLYAASISTLVSKVVLFILFLFMAKKDLDLKITWNVLVVFIIVILQGFIPMFNLETTYFWIAQGVSLVVIIALISRELIETIKVLYRSVFKKKTI